MTCMYCNGEPPSADGRTKCGWCFPVSLTSPELRAIEDALIARIAVLERIDDLYREVEFDHIADAIYGLTVAAKDALHIVHQARQEKNTNGR